MSAAGVAAVNTVVASDTILVAAVRTGDDAAFEELYRRYRPRIAAFVRGYLRDAGRAEDVTQEAFMSALRRLRQTDAKINFKPWIFEIARNAAIDQYRRNSRAEEVSIDLEGGFAQSDVSRVVGPRGPDSAAIDKERFDHLRGALDELSETYHRIIVMRELEGLSYREIGERMELTPAAVESTLFRARRKLVHEYAQLDTGRRCQLMGAVIGRLAEGLESDRDRNRLDRHARRCSSCRRRSRQLGVEPILPRVSIVAKVAALLPLPAFARRRFGGETGGSAAHQAAAPMGAVGAPTLEMGAAVVGKAVAVVAAVALVGGGGATLGGAGPLHLGGNGRTVLEKERGDQTAPQRPSGPPRERNGFSGAGRGKDTAAQPRDRTPVRQDSEAQAQGKTAAPESPKPEAQGGIPGVAPPALPAVPRDESSEPEPPPFDARPPSQPQVELPSVEQGASAPPLAVPSGAAATDAIGAVLGLQ